MSENNDFLVTDLEDVMGTLRATAEASEDIKTWSKNYSSEIFGDRKFQKLVMTAYVKDLDEVVKLYDSLIADIQNMEKCYRTPAITKAMILGFALYATWYENKEDGGLSQETKDAIEAFTFELEERTTKRQTRYVKRLYERGQTDKAEEKCKQYGLDFDRVISEYTLPINNADKSPVIREWLKEYFSSREAVQVSRIKQDMLDDGIIDMSDWSLVKNIASNDGYSSSGQRGIWQKVLT